jgi:hypothetical protein
MIEELGVKNNKFEMIYASAKQTTNHKQQTINNKPYTGNNK